MSHLNPGLLTAYNSLTDKHLAGYFSNTRIRRHLQRAGLITRSGRIVPDKEYRHKLIQRAHQRRVRECLAQAIFHKVLEMERLHQIEIKRKLEEFARRERVHKIKVERSKRYEEDIIRILSPRPPTGARGIRKQHSGPEGEHSESSESPGSSRPNTAPGKMQRPVRLKPIHSNSTTASARHSSPNRPLDSSHENTVCFFCQMDKEFRRRLTPVEASHGISPYCLPVINNFVTPVPPAKKRRERGVKVSPSSTIRGRRLRPTTATSGADVNEDLPMLRSSVHQSRVRVNMVYLGKTVHLSHDLTDLHDEVKVFQQHCGGENLCVYKGKLHEGETFQFISRRHRGFPFSLTFFLNGLQVERLSSCCEFKHRKGSRLGGRHGHFGFSSVEGASPCYKCIIAMGLDKKPTPPPKRVKEDGVRRESVTSPKDAPEMETERTGEDAASHSECETSQPQGMEIHVKAEPAPEEDKVRDDYEEDFEADDEGPAEGAEAKQRKSTSPTTEPEKEVNEKDASETEDVEKDEDIRSRSGSSSSGSDQEEADAEVEKEDEKTEQPKDVDQEETVSPPDEKDEPKLEEAAAATEGNSAMTKDSDMQDSAGDSTEIEISDTSLPSGNENRHSEDTSGGKDTEKALEGSKEKERAKSVQEKLAEAILKESQCSSEPELSDTSTEEEEESADKSPKQDDKDVRETVLTVTEQEQTPAEEPTCEESVTGECEVAQEQEELLKAKEQKEETEPHENNESTKDEVNEVEPATKAAEENTTSEVMGEVQHSVNEENVAQDDMSADLLEEPKSTDAEAAERYEAEEEKSAVETDIQPDETGQGAKTGEEDESSISELNKKTDEPAVPDNAEAEELAACETMEIKAESSEEREALSCEEAPVTDTEERQEADSKESPAASETGNTAEDSSTSPEGSGDTTVEKTADTSEEITRDESSKDGIKEDAEQAEASKDDSQLEQCELGEERTEKSEEADETEKQKPEEEEGEKRTHMNPDKMAEDEKTEEGRNDEIDKTEVEHNDESKVEEGRDEKENTTEEEADTNTEGKVAEEKEAENLTEDSNEENNDKPAEKDENSEHVEIKNEDKESEVKEGEERSEATPAVEEKDDEAETSEKEETGAELSEVTEIKNDEESEEQRDVTEGEEMSEHTEETDKSAEVDKENLKGSSIAEADDVGGSEAAADGTEETLNNMIETEKEKETEKVTSEKAEIDAENGEISGAESQPPDNEGEAPAEDTNDLKPAENNDEERQTQESAEELTGESAEKHQGDKVDPEPNTDVTKSDAKEEDDSDERHEGSIKNDSQPETSGTEIKEEPKLDDRKDSEETEKYENDNKADFDTENRESESIENNSNIQNFASSEDQEQTSAPLAADLDDAANRLDEDKTDKHPHTETMLGADLSAADGENGADTEEASKASEEGASVLLKPQAQSKEADNAEQAVVGNNQTPAPLASEDNTDLVMNWVNVHQSSKFFETFIEPLEDLREEISDSHVSSSVREETQSIELQTRSESPLKMVRKSEDEENAHKMVESELYSTQAEDEPRENNPAKDTLQEEEEEETEVKALIPTTDTEQNDSANGSRSLEEDKNQHEPTQGISEDNGVSKPEMESASGTDHSAPESVSEKQTDEKHADNVPDVNTNHPNTEDPLFPFNTEEPHMSRSPDRLKDADETREQTDEQSKNVTEVTDFTTSKSDEGSQESHSGEIQSKASDRRDVQLIQDIKHTLSKDRLSTFSVDETLFGRSSYPSQSAARTESGH
ncbi:glutamate-rich protein 3 [Parambassis ranga]|uniref:Glutamate-rich protein 3 n=1 Tax=Parambassis ranga TaxID=210632 RepID=A0A6P7IAJ0_9TELE|nr:glutamate-rich protein 3 [Parambassis ranga]